MIENTPNKIPQVLQNLLKSIVKIDFKERVYPEYKKLKEQREALQARLDEHGKNVQLEAQIKDLVKAMNKPEFHLEKKHYLITAIEVIEEVAKKHDWDLCKMNGCIYFYNGEFWEQFDDNSLENFLGEAALRMGIVKYDAKYYTFRADLVKQFLCMSYLTEPQLKDNEVNINLRNGTFTITRGKYDIKDFDKNDFLMYQLGFDFDPDAKAPMFQKYLDEVLPDKDCQDILSEYMGYIFLPGMKLEKALILYGSGANGKSVFFEIMSALVGKENITNSSLSSLTNSNGYFRAKIANKLLNYASEINGKLDTSYFKQMVSGEPVEARLPYKEPFTMKRYARFIFNCNELPKQVEFTDAYFRRFLIIPFEVTIPPEEQDKDLPNKIIADELSGVFNWVLKGLQRLQKNVKFTRSEKIDEQVASYRKTSDSVLLFLDDEGYEKSPDKHMKVKDLYKEYAEYCTDYGYMKLNRKNMKERLKKGQYQINRLNVGYVVNVTKDKPKEGEQCKLVLNKAREEMPM